MPSREAHEKACRIILENPHSDLHKRMDYPSRIVSEEHREYFHDPHDILVMIIEDNRPKNSDPLDALSVFEAGLIHIIQDEGYRGLEKVEEFLAETLKEESFESALVSLANLQTEWFDKVYDLMRKLGMSSRYVRNSGSSKIVKFDSDDRCFDLFLEASEKEEIPRRSWGKFDGGIRKCTNPEIHENVHRVISSYSF